MQIPEAFQQVYTAESSQNDQETFEEYFELEEEPN